MDKWKGLIGLWGRKNPDMKVLKVPAHHNLEAQHQALLRGPALPLPRRRSPLVCGMARHPQHRHHGLKGDGRVGVTGTGTAEFQALVSSKAADPYGLR